MPHCSRGYLYLLLGFSCPVSWSMTEKVIISFKATGGAPILKNKKVKVKMKIRHRDLLHDLCFTEG